MRLENWTIEPVTEEEFIVWGNVYNDPKKRFYEGEYIHTSGIKYLEKDLVEGDTVITRNSTYTLGVRK